ncbi:uncharacterized protein LOC108602691 [Drosophila busckii]|uniref:uncharacterized protein LOC108602691 n=1 Tax=Drosophila busckii TaxID=30019 RepID=UPI00083EAF60|nr:uncharacterized protein LOC108602691 [Drosophila busckii]
MSLNTSNPLLAVMKCEMCPNKVTNFAVGLCERCVSIWTSKRSLENIQITVGHVKSAIVSMHQRKSYEHMSAPFRQAIEAEQRKRRLKVELFTKFREKFQDGVLNTEENCVHAKFVADDNYFDAIDVDMSLLGVDFSAI